MKKVVFIENEKNTIPNSKIASVEKISLPKLKNFSELESSYGSNIKLSNAQYNNFDINKFKRIKLPKKILLPLTRNIKSEKKIISLLNRNNNSAMNRNNKSFSMNKNIIMRNLSSNRNMNSFENSEIKGKNNFGILINRNIEKYTGHNTIIDSNRKKIKFDFRKQIRKIKINNSAENFGKIKLLSQSPKKRIINNLNRNNPTTLNSRTIDNPATNTKVNPYKIPPGIFSPQSRERLKSHKPYGWESPKKKKENGESSVKDIYDHFLYQVKNDKMRPIKDFERFMEHKFHNPDLRFDQIYCMNKTYLNEVNKIKNDKSLAYKQDFDLREYQNTLLELLERRVGEETLYQLQQSFKKFDDQLEYVRSVKPKGRYSNLADKIKNKAPSFLVKRLKQLDEDNLVRRAQFWNVDTNKYNFLK